MSEEKQIPTQSAPYEVPLTKAFEKLTSEIFIFLLAYVILVIGLAVFGENLAKTIKTLLYVIPVLGVVAYVWLKQKMINSQANKGINVNVDKIKDSANVVGAKGVKDKNSIPDKVSVDVKEAEGNSFVGGVVFGDEMPDVNNKPADNSEKFLVDLFMKLDEENRGELISNALKLVKKQGARK